MIRYLTRKNLVSVRISSEHPVMSMKVIVIRKQKKAESLGSSPRRMMKTLVNAAKTPPSAWPCSMAFM